MGTLQKTHAQHLRAIAALGLPLIGSHLAQFAITLTDTIMLGWYDVTDLAAQVMAGSIFFVLFIVGSGFAWAVMPMVATAAATDDIRQMRRVTRMAMWISLIAAAVMLPVFWWSSPVLQLTGQNEDISLLAQSYLRIAGFAIVPGLLLMVLKNYLSALERAQVVLWATLAAVAVNVLMNYSLIFGRLGMPELGLQGAAIASVVSTMASLIVTLLYIHRVLRSHEMFQRLWRPDWEAFGSVFRLGWPIGLTNLAESGLFTASTIMMGWLGTLPLAAHGIALQITATMFMIHVGLSNVATIRAGRAVGENNTASLSRGAITVVLASAVVASVTVVIFIVFAEPLIGGFVDPEDPDRTEVIAIGVTLLAAAALFQFADAAQVMALGLLRGIQDTRGPMIIAAISYWGIGLPVSYGLGFYTSLGGVGVWLGLAAGLALAGLLMMIRFWRSPELRA